MRKKIDFRNFDQVLFFAPIFIFLIGVLSIHSASFKGQEMVLQVLAMKQMLWMGIGSLLMFLVIRADYYKLLDWAWPFYIFSLALLVGVLFAPARLGAHRWLHVVGTFNVQPSEVAKLAVILMLARFFNNHRPEFMSTARFCQIFLIVGVPFFLILKEPDLGTGLLLVPVFLAMLYLWGYPVKKILWIVGLAFLLIPVFILFLKDYQRARLMVFMNPNMDPLGAGYTIIQSKIAIGSGGLFGKGFLSGTQNRLQFLPEKHTDFIFGVIGEEGGFIACVLVVFLFAAMAQRGYQIAAKTPERFGSALACGLTTLITSQAVINLGMTTGLLPVVGVPLPLVSYGGTSVIVTMIAIGLLINIKLRRPLF